MGLRGWRGVVSGIGAVAIVAAVALLTVGAIGFLDRDDAETVGLGVQQPPVEVEETTTTTRVRRSTTTTTQAPAVLGETTEREPGPAATTTTTTPTSATAAPVPATSPPATAAPAPSPPPTAPPTTVCRNSTDPACGPFRWDPEPAPADVQVDVVSAPREARVGEPVTFTLEYVERAGATAVGACGSWTVRGPGVSNGTTCEALAHSCDRYGPHDPPPPSADRVRVTRTITFDEPGTYDVSAEGFTATHLPDGCASPYLASWDVEPYVLTVVDAER